MSKSIFYYPVTLVQGGGSASAVAPLVPALPLDSDQSVSILAQDVGAQPQGMYVNDGVVWRFALPYIPMCEAGIFANDITIYADPMSSTTAPAGSTVYKNGILQMGLAITAGTAIYAVLTPSASGGGGSYVLPPANSTTLGGVVVPGSSNLSIDGFGNIDIKTTLINTINAKVGTIADVSGATGVTLIGTSTGPAATLKTISGGNVSVTDQTNNIMLDVPIASASTLGVVRVGSGLSIDGAGVLSASGGSGAITLTGDITGSGTGSVVTTLSNSGVIAGTYTKVTVDAKGRVTVGANLAGSDVNNALGYTAYDGTANPNGFLTTNQSIAVTGDATGTGSTAITLTLANSGVVANTYKSVTVDAKGRVTAGTNPTTLAGFGITDGLSNTGGSVSGNITMTSGATIKGLPTPAVGGDAASKDYVDTAVSAVASGTSWKTNAQVASTANIAALTGLPIIDGYQTVAADRILLKNQTAQAENGVYVAAAGAWSRATDVDAGSEIQGMAILVINGTVNAFTQWVNTNTTAPVVGTDPITFTQLMASGSAYTAGTGLSLIGNQFSITDTGVVAGTFTKVTVNAQGQVTTGANLNASDVNTALGYTAYNGVTNPSGFLTANQAITLSGDATGSGSTAITVTLATSGVIAGTYTKVTVDAKGRVTVGANLASSDVTTALTYTPVNKAGDTLTGAINYAPTVSVAAAATTNIGAAASNFVTVTGNTTITAFDSIASGALREVVFTGTPTLTHNGTSLILPTGANIVVAAGDSAAFLSLGGGNWRCVSYSRASGAPLVGAPDATKLPLAGGTLSGALNLAPAVTLASAATVNIGAAAANDISITGSTTITAFDTIAAGAHRVLTFAGALTLTHNGTSLILPGAANVTTAAGDVASFVSLGGGNWRCEFYTRAVSMPATLAGTESLTNKTLVNAIITNFTESGVSPAAGASHTVDLSNGTDIDVTTNANFTLTLPSPGAGKSFTVTVNYGGTHTLSFAGGTIRWAGGSAPTATSVSGKADIYVFKSNRAGTAWFGSDGGRNF